MGTNSTNAGALVFDLETMPIDGAETFLKEEPVEAPSNYKDPIKIRDYIEKATVKRALDCCLDPDLCRIAVIGWLDEGETEPIVVRILSEDEERHALRMFWTRVSTPGGSHRRTISFYGLSFDWPVIVQRSRYLGVPFALPTLDKYRTPHTDLHALLTFNGATKHTHSLDFYAKRIGLARCRSTPWRCRHEPARLHRCAGARDGDRVWPAGLPDLSALPGAQP